VQKRQASAYQLTSNLIPVIVTDDMIKAGLAAMNELPRDENLEYVVTSVFLAMEYSRQSQNETQRLLERAVDEGERQCRDS
jgi:hypothetical protein